MSWLYESIQIPSDINGIIRCNRMLGTWSVTVGDTGQTNGYLNTLWRQALTRIPRDGIRRILMLGFGTGGAVPEFYKRFPNAHLTAIEIDPVMVSLAHRFGTLRHRFPEVHIGSAAEILPTLTGPYDVIVSDMFLSHTVAPETTDGDVQEQIARLLHPQGHILINAYDQPAMVDAFRAQFAESSRWKQMLSWVGHFRPHGAGVLGDPLPEGYAPYPACAEYIKREYGAWKGFHVVNDGDACGVSQHIGPLRVDRYIGSTEPACKRGGARVVMWHPPSRRDKPPGWRRAYGAEWRLLTGYVDVSAGVQYDTWSERARRERHKWLVQQAYEIRTLDADAYCAAYAKCGKSRLLIGLFSEAVRRRAMTHGDRQQCYAVVARDTGTVVAGFVSLDVPEISASVHVTSFVCDDGRACGAGTALVDQWLTQTHTRGLRYADFDGFYAPGAPKDWKGFSAFKAQFGTRFIAYPQPLWRFVSKG